jgi:Zn-dependent metalloprotease
VRFQQRYQGLPVIAGELNVNLSDSGELLAISGEILPTITLGTTPAVDAAAAQAAARDLVVVRYEADAAALTVSAPELSLFNPVLVGGPGARRTSLAWRLEVRGQSQLGEFREYVVVDASLGTILLSFDQIAEAKERHICNANNVPDTDGNENTDCALPLQYVRNEGGAATGNADVDLAYDYSGDTYDYYLSVLGRDSIDGAGLPLISLVKYCPDAIQCPYGNAFWNGSQMTYGDGFASADDVVAHELSHGVTERTSNLLYYYQAGAMNEAMSDIFGEFVDQTNGAGDDSAGALWFMGEDLPGGAIRYMADPPQGGQPDTMSSPLYVLDPSQGDSGGVHTNSGVANKAAFLLSAGEAFNGQTVSSIGITKTAHLFYETQLNFLTSGSDYADLADALRQGCADLIGQYGISAADCVEVNDAVLATEMDLSPVKAPAPDVEVCAPGQTLTDTFYDDFENTVNTSWLGSALTGATNNWSTNPEPTIFSYATSGTGSAMNSNASFALPQLAQKEDSTLAMTNNVAVTAGTYAHFRHAYDFDAFGADKPEGAVVEYSTNNGSTWQDAAPLFAFNGYNGTINASDNALIGRQAFTGISNGFVSSRLNLGSLAGQNVRFRFHLSVDSEQAREKYMSWSIDQFRVYTCAGIATPSAPSSVILGNVTVERGTGPVTQTVATVSDNSQVANSLQVSVAGAPAGLTVSVTNTNGLVTAFVNCACSVAVGSYPITLTVRNGANLTATNVFEVAVTQAGQKVADPGFEQGELEWEADATSFPNTTLPLCDTSACSGAPRTGSGWLRFGARAGQSDTAYAQQVVTTPAGAATISFYLRIYAHNNLGASQYVALSVDGDEVFRVTDANTQYDAGFVKVTVPVTGLTAGTHTLRFDSQSSAAPANAIVRFSIDDFTLISADNQCALTDAHLVYIPAIRR